MNTYPAWWDKNITVYNKYEAASGEVTWQRTNLTGAFVKNTGERIVLGDTEIDTNKTICRIRKDNNFLPKYEWDALTDRTGKFTLAPGDIIVFATVSDDVDEYTDGFLSSADLLNKYKKAQGAMVIEYININVGTSLACEHYHIKGV